MTSKINDILSSKINEEIKGYGCNNCDIDKITERFSSYNNIREKYFHWNSTEEDTSEYLLLIEYIECNLFHIAEYHVNAAQIYVDLCKLLGSDKFIKFATSTFQNSYHKMSPHAISVIAKYIEKNEVMPVIRPCITRVNFPRELGILIYHNLIDENDYNRIFVKACENTCDELLKSLFEMENVAISQIWSQTKFEISKESFNIGFNALCRNYSGSKLDKLKFMPCLNSFIKSGRLEPRNILYNMFCFRQNDEAKVLLAEQQYWLCDGVFTIKEIAASFSACYSSADAIKHCRNIPENIFVTAFLDRAMYEKCYDIISICVDCTTRKDIANLLSFAGHVHVYISYKMISYNPWRKHIIKKVLNTESRNKSGANDLLDLVQIPNCIMSYLE